MSSATQPAKAPVEQRCHYCGAHPRRTHKQARPGAPKGFDAKTERWVIITYGSEFRCEAHLSCWESSKLLHGIDKAMDKLLNACAS